MASHATRNETIKLLAIESDSDAKNAPATPIMNAGGMWMMMVESDDPANGLVNSSAAFNTVALVSPGRARAVGGRYART